MVSVSSVVVEEVYDSVFDAAEDDLEYRSTHAASLQAWRMKLRDLPIRKTFCAKDGVMILGIAVESK